MLTTTTTHARTNPTPAFVTHDIGCFPFPLQPGCPGPMCPLCTAREPEIPSAAKK